MSLSSLLHSSPSFHHLFPSTPLVKYQPISQSTATTTTNDDDGVHVGRARGASSRCSRWLCGRIGVFERDAPSVGATAEPNVIAGCGNRLGESQQALGPARSGRSARGG